MSGPRRTVRTLVVGPGLDSAAETVEQAREDIVTDHVSTASSGLDYLDSRRADCVVTSHALPNTDGIDLVETARESRPALPVILVTDDGSEELARQAIAADVTDYLHAPATQEQIERLADRIGEAVGRSDPTTHLRELITASNDIYWMFTADWDELLFINDTYEILWGRSVDALREEPLDFIEGVHPDDRDRVRTAMDALAGGDAVDFEVRVNAEENYGHWVWIQGEPVRNSAGTVVRVAGFCRDITDRVRGRQRFERAETRFKTLAEHFPNGGVHYFDDELRYRYVSGSGFEHIDTNPEDLIGNTIYEVDRYSEAEVEMLEPLMEATLDGERQTVEIPYEGHIYEVHSVPLRDDPDTVSGGFFITQDVTEQREHERKLAARSAAIEAANDGIAILDENDEYAFVNQAHADIYGYDDPEAFVGNSWRMCYDDDGEKRIEREVLPTLDAEGAWRGEATGVREDGSTFPQELSLSTIDDGRMICVVRDITERKERERQLQRQNERLEEFTSVVTHDLRGPLMVAKGRLDLAREDSDSPHIDDAIEGVDRAMDLLADLRALAREGENVGSTAEVGLSQIVEECWGAVETGTATLEVESDRTLSADRSRLRQVFENLFRNAVKHGGEDVTVRVGATDDGFYVADDGPGIPADERDQVFESGYSTSESGTGYGLNIVAEVVVAHGWEIDVAESEAGGARFEVSGVE